MAMDLATQEPTYAVARMGEALPQIMEENIGAGGMEVADLERIKIPAGGATTWLVNTVSGEEALKVIEGIVIHFSSGRAYWKESFSGDNVPPDCSSTDMVQGVLNGNVTACKTCPMNQFGTSIGDNGVPGKGKACSEIRTLYILQKDSLLPMVLRLPVTSVKPCRKYFVALATKAKAYYNVISQISLGQEKGNFTYSVAQFAMKEELDDVTKKAIIAYREQIIPLLKEHEASTDIEQI